MDCKAACVGWEGHAEDEENSPNFAPFLDQIAKGKRKPVAPGCGR